MGMISELALLELLTRRYPSWTSSKEITAELNISVRTLRNWVKNINCSKQMVLSSAKGYRIQTDEWNVVQAKIKEAGSIPGVSSSLRQKYLLKQLLLNNDGLNFYDLAECLFISESTLNIELTGLRKQLETYGILLVKKEDVIRLIGNEQNIRKLMSDNIYEEVQDRLLSNNILEESFPDMDIVKIRSAIQTILNDHHLTIDDFGITDLILHVCIMLDRIENHQFSSLPMSDAIVDSPFFAITKECLAAIGAITQTSIPDTEITAIAPLVSLNTRQLLDQNITINDLMNVVDRSVIHFVRTIIDKVRETYDVDLNSELFLVRFSLHLNQMIHNHTKSARNPLLRNIKDSFPLVFEISVYIADLIHKEYPEISLDDHDISYIALHIGMAVEKNEDGKITTHLIIPDYSALKDNLVNRIADVYQNSLNIVAVVNHYEYISFLQKEDLILSVQRLDTDCVASFVQISPFFNKEDREKIDTAIASIREQKSRREELSMDELFHSDRFILYDSRSLTPHTVIHDLSERLYSTGYVSKGFEKEVLQREDLSSTAYSNIAVPHTMNTCGLKTGIAVAVFKHRIPWKSNTVNIALLLVVKPNDKEKFRKVFQQVVKLFTSSSWNNQYKGITDYDDFMKLLRKMIDGDGD